MTALPQRVIVDDTDPQVQYSGSDQWILMNSEQHRSSVPDVYSNGPSFQNTTHFINTTSDTASLSFRFQGSSPQVYGTSILTAYECFIDGASIGSTLGWPRTEPTILENNDLLCDGAQFTEGEGEHTLTLNLTTDMIRPILWFDYITYVPAASAPLGSATMLVDRLDSTVVYSPGDWLNDASYGLASYTHTNGSFLTFNFTGTSVSWIGYIPQGPGVTSRLASGTYSIDDGSPELFTLAEFQSTPGYSGDLPNSVFFTSPDLSPGPHTLKVINRGDDTTTPLTLNHLVVTNNLSTVPPAVSTSLPPTSPSSPPTSSSLLPAASPTVATSNNKPDPFAPKGVIIGVFVGIALLGLVAFFLWRRTRRRDPPGTTTPRLIMPFGVMSPGPAIEEVGSHTPKVDHSHPLGPEPPIVLAGLSGVDDPGAIPHARNSNQSKVLPRVPPLQTAHESSDPGSTTTEAAGPPPSYSPR